MTDIFSSIGSGIDVASLIQGLVTADSGNLTRMQTQSTNAKSASSTLSGVGTALSSLRTAAQAISSMQNVASFSATSSDTNTIVASALGSAQPGTYTVNVVSTAAEQRTYSASFASNGDALGQEGDLSIGIGTAHTTIQVAATDSLAGIAAKINASQDADGNTMRVQASVFYDGSAYRLQVRGLDTGSANQMTFTEDGTSLDLNGTGQTATSGKTAQSARDAVVVVDGFTVTRSTNQIDGIVPGVTLAVKQPTTSPISITVAPDPATLSTKVLAVVTAYNSVVNQMHSVAGYGGTKATVAALAGDSALRSIAQQLSRTISSSQLGQGSMATLGQIGLQQTKDGLLQIDSAKLQSALSKDPASVQRLLGRAQGATSGGAMANLADTIDRLTALGTGMLTTRQKYFTDQAKKLDTDATKEQDRLNDYAARLQKQFTTMNTAVAANQTLLTQLANITTST
jgi:flagellar hook-associated protein 2